MRSRIGPGLAVRPIPPRGIWGLREIANRKLGSAWPQAIREPLTYREIVLEDNPVAYWRLGDLTATPVETGAYKQTGTYGPSYYGSWGVAARFTVTEDVTVTRFYLRGSTNMGSALMFRFAVTDGAETEVIYETDEINGDDTYSDVAGYEGIPVPGVELKAGQDYYIKTWNTASGNRHWAYGQSMGATGIVAYPASGITRYLNNGEPTSWLTGWLQGVATDQTVHFLLYAGDAAVDETGVHHGTYVGSPTVGIAGALVNNLNTAVDLDGTAGYPRVRWLNPIWVPKSSPYSFESWIRTTKTTNKALWSYGPVNQHLTFVYDTHTVIYDASSTVQINHPSIADGKWHHFVVTHDGSTARIYVDGALAGSGSIGTIPDAGPSAYFVLGQEQDTDDGTYDTAQSWVGAVDEFAAYNAVLTGDEIQAHYTAGSA